MRALKCQEGSIRAKNRSAGLGSYVFLQRRLVRVHISSRPTVAACPIQIDNVRFPPGHRILRKGKTDPLPWSVEAPELKARLDLAVRAGRVYVDGGSENQNGNSGLTGNEGDGSSSSAHKRCPIRTNHWTGHR